MSDIQEEQKRLYKRAEENDIKAKMKPLFPEDVEMICISKDDYDRLYGDLSYENVELKETINKAIIYMQNYINVEDSMMCESAREEFKMIINILQGKEK